MFDKLYKTAPDEIEIFGAHWCGPKAFTSIGEHLVARYESADYDEGQTAEVFCKAAPARFYKIRVLEGIGETGNVQPPYVLSTGSGRRMAELAAQIAEAISEAMLGVDVPETALDSAAFTAP